ncbi:MAG: ligase-associated DNA damage response exonuclease [Deltaproteobacteria bacterium]|nr:ligase-associated DNA damage response exonuclease [Deltaproteobacteria bacterium]
MTAPLLQLTNEGLFCPAGGFHIDPWEPVERAVLTHGHGDHARPGSTRYLAPEPGRSILDKRLATESGAPTIDTLRYGERQTIGDVSLSFHPAGHVLGSAQVRLEHRGEVWVVTGDYKRAADPTCAPFEVVRCDTLVTEATFALPIYRWPDATTEVRAIASWWRANAEAGRASLLYVYSLGKAQRILAELSALTDQTVYTHGAIEALVERYRDEGVEMLPTKPVQPEPKGTDWAGRLVMAPPSVRRSRWLKRFGDHETAFASGWMLLRATRKQRGLDRGFTLSDHADWPALIRTVQESEAERVLCTHGRPEVLARFLREERGLDAAVLATPYAGEEGSE